MPRPALTAVEIADFRERAVELATRLFAERGIAAVSMRSLAAELGVSPMTPYRYFANVEDLFAAVRAQAFRTFADAQQRAAAKAEDPLSCLLALQKAYVKFALRAPDAYRVMFELKQPHSSAYPELAREEARAFSYLHEATKAAIAAGLLEGDPLTMAHRFWAETHGAVSLHLAGKLGLGRSLEDLVAVVPRPTTRPRRKRS